MQLDKFKLSFLDRNISEDYEMIRSRSSLLSKVKVVESYRCVTVGIEIEKSKLPQAKRRYATHETTIRIQHESNLRQKLQTNRFW